MGLYVYCVAPEGHDPPDGLRGLEGGAVRSLPAGGLVLWVSETERVPRPSVQTVRAHDRVVRASVTESVTTLPLRFGQWFGDPGGAGEVLGEEAERYRRALDEVAGAMEFGLRLVDPETDPGGEQGGEASPAAESGRAYMEALARRHAARRERRGRADELAGEIRRGLGGLVREQRSRPPDGSGATLARVAHLVDRSDFEAYREAVRGLEARHPELQWLTSGPWPPYTFAP